MVTFNDNMALKVARLWALWPIIVVALIGVSIGADKGPATTEAPVEAAVAVPSAALSGDNKTVARTAKYDLGFSFIGKYCDRSFPIQPHVDKNAVRSIYVVKGEYLSGDAELAFECTIIVKMLDTAGVLTSGKMPSPEMIAEVAKKEDQILVECENMPIVSTGNAADKDKCSAFYEVNRGQVTHCQTSPPGAPLKQYFTAKNGKVVVTIFSKPLARNRFKGNVPSYKCKFRRTEGDPKIKPVGWPASPRMLPHALPGFYFVENCNEALDLTPADDLIVVESVTQPFPGRTFFDCTKTVKVPEKYVLMAKCTKQRLIEGLGLDHCLTYYQVNGGEKVCHPDSLQGTWEPKDGKVDVRIVSDAYESSKFMVGKPLYECRFAILTVETKKGYIIRTNEAGIIKKQTEMSKDDDIKKDKDKNQGDFDIPKMDKPDFQKKVVARDTPVDGVAACGGRIELSRYGYTFKVEAVNATEGSQLVTFDCSFNFNFPPPGGRDDVVPMISTTCDEMPVEKKGNGPCPVSMSVNNEREYCHGKDQLVGLFPVHNGQMSVRIRADPGTHFGTSKPLFKCLFQGVYVLKDKYAKQPQGLPFAGQNPIAVTASTDGSNPTYFYGDNKSPTKDVDTVVKITVPKAKNKDQETLLYLHCPRPNVAKLNNTCDFTYTVDNKTSYCAKDEVEGLYQVAPSTDVVTLTVKSKKVAYTPGYPTFQCKCFVYDSPPLKDIDKNVKLSEPGVVGQQSTAREGTATTGAPSAGSTAPGTEAPATDAPGTGSPDSGAAAPPAPDTNFNNQSSSIGTVGSFMDMPISLLSDLYITDLTNIIDTIANISDAKLGQIGTMAAMGHLGHLGGLLVGRVYELGIIPKFTTSHFGGLGELKLSLLAKLAKTGKLGILEKLTMGQLLTLARIGMLQRMSLGHITHLITINQRLKYDIMAIAEEAKFKNQAGEVAPEQEKAVGAPKKLKEDDVPAFAMHMPKVDQVYDMITLVHVLRTSLIDLRKEHAADIEKGKEPKVPKAVDATSVSFHPKDIEKTMEKLKKNIDNIIGMIIALIEKYDDGCEVLKLEEESLMGLTSIQVEDIGTLLIGIARKTLDAFSVKEDILKELRRIQLYVLNRLLLGTIGSLKHLLGRDMELIVSQFAETLCKDKDELWAGITKLQADANEQEKASIKEGAGNSKIDTPYNKEKIGKRRRRPKRDDSEAKETTSAPDKGGKGKEPTGNGTVPRMSLDNSLFVCMKLLGSPFNNEARNFAWKDKEGKEKSKESRKDKAKDITKEQHCTAVSKGEEGGALKDSIHRKLAQLMAIEMLKDIDLLEEEMGLMDTSRKFRVVRIFVGFGAGLLKSFGEGLNKIDKTLYDTTDLVTYGVEDLMVCSAESWALSLSGIFDPTLLTMGSTVSETVGGTLKNVDSLLSPLGDIYEWDVDKIADQGLTSPVLDTLAVLINRLGDLTVNQLRYFLISLLSRSRALLKEAENTLVSMEGKLIMGPIELYAGAMHAIASRTSTSNVKVLTLVVGMSKIMGEDRLLKISNAILETGSPVLSSSANKTLLRDTETIESMAASIESTPGEALSKSMMDTLGMETKKAAKGTGDGNGTTEASVTTTPATASTGPPLVAKKFEEMSQGELRELMKTLSEQMRELFVQTEEAVNRDDVSLGQVMDVIEGVLGHILGQVVEVGFLWIGEAKQQVSSDYYANKYSVAMNLCGLCGKVFIGILGDIGNQDLTTVASITSQISEATKTGKGYEDAMSRLGDAIETEKERADRQDSDIGVSSAALANGVGNTVDDISTHYYDFGHKKCSIETIIAGSLGSLAKDMKDLPPGQVEQMLKERRNHALAKTDRREAYERKRAITSGTKTTDKYLSRQGLIVVGIDNGSSHFNHFYDEDDIVAQAKDEILDRVAQILLTDAVYQNLMESANGSVTEPITFEVNITETTLGVHDMDSKKKINVTIGSITDRNRDYKAIQLGKKDYDGYTGQMGTKLGGEYRPGDNQTCITWREDSIKKIDVHPTIFMPTCNADGTYRNEQCDEATSICWCVDEFGSEIANTMVRMKQPVCPMTPKNKKEADKQKAQLKQHITLGDNNTIPLGYEEQDDEKVKPYAEAKMDQNCAKELRQKEKLGTHKVMFAVGVFKPACDADGNYSPVQCDRSGTHCWCVTTDGHEIPNTGVLGKKPKNCKELTKKKSHTLAVDDLSWDYLWVNVRKWQDTVKNVMDKKSDDYKPKGVLVKLPKSSGFSDSVMFLAQEPAGEGLESPYNIWVKIMAYENPNFKAEEYLLSTTELKKLEKINVPDGYGGGGTQSVSIALLIKTYPFAEDLFEKVGKDTKKLQAALSKMSLDWNRLRKYDDIKGSTGQGEGQGMPGVIGSGHMSMKSAKKMCFCHGSPEGAGQVVDGGAFGGGEKKKSGGMLDSLVDKYGPSEPGSESRSNSGSGSGKGKGSGKGSGGSNDTGSDSDSKPHCGSDGNPCSGDETGSGYGSDGDSNGGNSNNTGVFGKGSDIDTSGGLSGGGASGASGAGLLNSIVDNNPFRSILEVEAGAFCRAPGMKYENIAVRMSFFSMDYWTRLSSMSGYSMEDLQKTLKTDFEKMYRQPISKKNCGEGCVDETVAAVQDVSGGKLAEDKVNLGGLCEVLIKGKVTLGGLFFAMGVDVLPLIGRSEHSFANLFIAPFVVVDTFFKHGLRSAIKKAAASLQAEGGPLGVVGDVLAGRAGIEQLITVPFSFFGFDGVAKMWILSWPRALLGTCSNFISDTIDPSRIPRRIIAFYANLLTFRFDFWASFSGGKQAVGSTWDNIHDSVRNITFKMIDFSGNFIGESGVCFLKIGYKACEYTIDAVMGPFLLIPRVLFFTNGTIIDRLLAVPILVIDLFGDTFKPILSVFEPLLRTTRYMIYGEWEFSLHVGAKVAIEEVKKTEKKENKRRKREALTDETDTTAGPDEKDTTAGPDVTTTVDSLTTEAGDNEEALPGPNGDDLSKKSLLGVNKPGPFSGPKPVQPSDASLLKGGPKKKQAEEDAPPPEGEEKGEKGEKPDTYEPTKPADGPVVDASSYKGAPPEGGYAEGAAKAPGNDNSFLSRLLNSPTFLLTVGGKLFMPFCGVLGPLLQAVNEVAFGEGNLLDCILRVPKILKTAPGLITPIGALLEEFVPLVEIGRDVYNGKKGMFQVALQAPMLATKFSSGILSVLWNSPWKILGDMMTFFEGEGGILSMFRAQKSTELKPGAKGRLGAKSSEYYSPDKKKQSYGFFLDILLGFFEDLSPLFSFLIGISNGLLGSILDPRLLLKLNLLNLNLDPVTSFVSILLNPIALYQATSDNRMFLMSVLGGQDPDNLKDIGIDADMMLKMNVDPAKFLSGGLVFIPSSKRADFGTIEAPNAEAAKKIGIDETKLKKVDLTLTKLFKGGLLEANPEKLIDFGVDPFNLINRLLRNSIVNKMALIQTKINFKKLLSAGISPDLLFAIGVGSVDKSVWEELKIDPTKTDDPITFAKIGINGNKLAAKEIDVKDFLENGIQNMDKEFVKNKFGLNLNKLLGSIFCGFDKDRLQQIGIDPSKLIRAGLSPVSLIMGSAKLLAMDADGLKAIGIDIVAMKNAAFDPSALFKNGFGLSTPKTFLRMGVDPERLIIGLLSTLGLDMLVGSANSGGSSILGIVFSLFSLVGNLGMIGQGINMIPILGPMLFNQKGDMVGIPKFILVDILGLNGKAGILGFVKKYMDGEGSAFDFLKLLNPINLFRMIFGNLKPSAIMHPFGTPANEEDEEKVGWMSGLMGASVPEGGDSGGGKGKEKKKAEDDDDAWGG